MVQKKKRSVRKTAEDCISKIKEDINTYLPTIVLWLLRVLMIFQIYMYHSF